MDHLVFLLLGLGNGAVFASLALALVVTFRSSGVVNFATGAVALYVAYTYAFLRKGLLLDPIPGTPKTIDLGRELGLVPAVVISLTIAAVFGMVLYAVVFRPLRTAPPVAKAVASIGVLIVVQASLAVQVGTSPVNVKAILPTRVYELGGSRVPGDRLWFAAIVVAVTIALILVFRMTRFGLATRAAAESEKGALVTGLSPERIALANWALSAVIAGLSGILIAPIVPLIPVSYTLFIVPALAAALVGNFTSVGPAVGAGLVIGMLQSEMQFLQNTKDWLPDSGTSELVPLVVIFAFLVFRGRPLPSRGAVIQSTLGRAPRPHGLLLPGGTALVLVTAGLLLTHGSYRAAIITSLLFALVALSWVVVTGFAGQISLAQLTLAGVGAFSLTRIGHGLGVPFPLAPVLAALVATVIGVVVGLPALRIRGLPVAVVTLSLAVAVESLWFRSNQFNGGIKGAPIDDPTLFGFDLGIGSGSDYPRLPFAFLCLVVLVVVALWVVRIRTGRLGASMLAVRANERSAAAAGISVAQTKIIAFAIGAFIAGLGGALLGYAQQSATADSYTAISGIAMFGTVYLAGITSLSGGLLAGATAAGGLVFVFLDRSLSFGDYYVPITGVGLVLTVILNPEGMVGPFHQLTDELRARRRAQPEEPVETGGPRKSSPQPTPEPGDALLTLTGVSVRYGGVVANDDVSFSVREGEIVGLIGPNGAGKTTLVDAISGFVSAEGEVVFMGESLQALKPHQRIRRGLGRTFQGIELYEDLTVEENVGVGQTAAAHGGAHLGPPDSDVLDRLYGVLKLDAVRDRPVRELSQGQRQLVSIARALAGRPKVVILDEPAAGLDSRESQWLGERLRDIRKAGVTVLMVDHDMGLVLNVCDRIVVLDLGAVIADGTPAQVQSDPGVARAYLGATHSRVEVTT